MDQKKSLFSSNAFKHGGLATLFTVIAIVSTILINVLAIALADKFPLKIDLTPKQEHTISDVNKAYIKKINTDVTITVSVDENYYKNGFAQSLAQGEIYTDAKIEDN